MDGDTSRAPGPAAYLLSPAVYADMVERALMGDATWPLHELEAAGVRAADELFEQTRRLRKRLRELHQ